MIAIVCIDDKGGMLFNHRRQSQDRMLRADLLREAARRPVWMNAYSARQFGAPAENLRVAEDFPDRSGSGELCFVEDRDLSPLAGKLEGLILYRWNRAYPSDVRFPTDLPAFVLMEQREFPGTSHERIIRKIYVREADHGQEERE